MALGFEELAEQRKRHGGAAFSSSLHGLHGELPHLMTPAQPGRTFWIQVARKLGRHPAAMLLLHKQSNGFPAECSRVSTGMHFQRVARKVTVCFRRFVTLLARTR